MFELIKCLIGLTLPQYYFYIEYYERKRKKGADALYCFQQQDDERKTYLQAENTSIFYC